MKKEILFSYFPKKTIKRYREVISIFSNFDKFWQAGYAELKQLPWQDNLIHEFLLWREEIDENKVIAELQKENIQTILFDQPEYPELLKQIYDPPICIFARGNLKNLGRTLAVVGSRKISPYGKMVAENLVREACAVGFAIVSGLALGTDAAAHAAALEAKGRTIAVLGGGVDKNTVQPRTNYTLSEAIIKNNGAVISEYPPGFTPTNYTFPERNRIIAGMSLGTLVIEAGEKSGALITARLALESNREVFAVPQNIYNSGSYGPNHLIKQGAHVVTEINDILAAFNMQSKSLPENKPDKEKWGSAAEKAIGEILNLEPMHIDEIIRKSGLSSNSALSNLTLLEIKGLVKNLGGMRYSLLT